MSARRSVAMADGLLVLLRACRRRLLLTLPAVLLLRVWRRSIVTTLLAPSLRLGVSRDRCGRSLCEGRLGALRRGGRRGVGVVRARIRLDVAAR